MLPPLIARRSSSWLVVIVAVVLAATSSDPLGAQTDAPGAPAPADGPRLRITLPRGGVLTGHGVLDRSDTLVFVGDRRGDTLRLPLASIHRLQAAQGTQSHFWAGLGIGAVAGALVGAVAGYAEGDDPVDPNCIFCNLVNQTAGEKAAGGAVVIGLFGAAGGGLVGLALRTDRFVAIAPERLRLQLDSGRDGGIRLGLRVR